MMTDIFPDLFLFTSFVLKPNFHLKFIVIDISNRFFPLPVFELDQVTQLILLVRVERDIVFVEIVYSTLAIAYSNRSFEVCEFSCLSMLIWADYHSDISPRDSNREHDRNTDRLKKDRKNLEQSDTNHWEENWNNGSSVHRPTSAAVVD